MSQISKTTAKSYFETGDVPTQSQFENLIDSTIWYDDNLNTSLSGTAWDGTNKTKTLTSNTVLTLSTTRNTGLLEVKQDATGSRTLTIAGVVLTINTAPNSITLIGFYKNSSGEIRFVVELNPIESSGADVTPPTVVSAEVIDNTHIEFIFSENTTPTLSGWSFKKNGSALAASAVAGSGTTWSFTVASINAGDTILRSYNSATGNTLDTASNELASFTDQAVTNSLTGIALNAPTGFSATPSGANMNLVWTDTNSSPNEVGYEIRRNSTNTTVGATLIETTVANVISFVDVNPGTGTWYYFCRAKGNGTTTNHSSYASASGTIAGGGLDADAVTYFTAVEATGATISAPHKTAYSDWVVAEKAAARYNKYIAIYPFMGGTALAHLINAKNPGTHNITWNGSVTHDANGVRCGGTVADYGNTGVNATTHLLTDDVHMSIYINDDNDATGYDMGMYAGAAISLARISGNAYTNCHALGDLTTAATDLLGMNIITRIASNEYHFVKAGTVNTKTNTSTGRPNGNLTIGIDGGLLSTPSTRRYAIATIGTGFTTTQAQGLNTNTVTLETALGRNA